MQFFIQFLIGVLAGISLILFMLNCFPYETTYLLNHKFIGYVVLAFIFSCAGAINHSNFEDNQNEQPKSDQSKQ